LNSKHGQPEEVSLILGSQAVLAFLYVIIPKFAPLSFVILSITKFELSL
jgi:hypothetical protein